MADDGSLGKDIDAAVEELVATGRFESRDDVLREGVRLVQEREARLAELEGKIEASLKAGEDGKVSPAREALTELRDRYAAMDRKRA